MSDEWSALLYPTRCPRHCTSPALNSGWTAALTEEKQREHKRGREKSTTVVPVRYEAALWNVDPAKWDPIDTKKNLRRPLTDKDPGSFIIRREIKNKNSEKCR